MHDERPGVRGARAPRRRASADRAGGGRAPLRLRPLLRRHRRRARLERRGGPRGGLVRRAAPARKEDRMTTVPDELDRRFRDAAAAGRAPRRRLRLHRLPGRPAARRRQRARRLPDLVRPRARAGARGARRGVRRARPALPGRSAASGASSTSTSRAAPRVRPPGRPDAAARLPAGGARGARPRPVRARRHLRRPRPADRQAAGARAVGGALNRNPIPIVVPCHRIVGRERQPRRLRRRPRAQAALLGLEGRSAG